MKPDLSIDIAGIKLQNPVMNASGTFDVECVTELIDVTKLGAYVQKSTTLKGREGNPQPRTLEVLGGILNRIGLENKGVMDFVHNKLPDVFGLLKGLTQIIASVAGELIDDYVQSCVILKEFSKDRIAALEINISCPNVENGLVFGCSPKLAFDLIRKIRVNTDAILIVKLTPNVTNISEIAIAAKEAGANAISLINTVKGTAYISRGLNADQWIEGGLSGPCIKPIALSKVREVAKAVDVPLIGMGGISNTEDALDFLRIKNVKAIAVGTANFRNPSVMIDIIKGLEEYFKKNNYANMVEFKRKEITI